MTRKELIEAIVEAVSSRKDIEKRLGLPNVGHDSPLVGKGWWTARDEVSHRLSKKPRGRRHKILTNIKRSQNVRARKSLRMFPDADGNSVPF